MEPTFWSTIAHVWAQAQPIIAALGLGGVTLAAIVGMAYALFKFLGEKWIGNKFAQQLELFRAEQQRELERLRQQINAALDRTARLHTKEFEVLPEIWARLVALYFDVVHFTNHDRSWVEVENLSAGQLDEYLATRPFTETQKSEIRGSTNRQKTFDHIDYGYRMESIANDVYGFNTFLKQNGIFLKPVMRSQIVLLHSLLQHMFHEHDANISRSSNTRASQMKEHFNKNGPKVFREIEAGVTERLWESTKPIS